jgi:signal transduction histidine kinase
MSRLLSTSAVDSARQQLDRTRELVKDGLADARRSIWDLRSHEKDGETLPARLTRTVQQIAAPAAIATKLDVSGTYMPLAASVENELLRIAKEALTNVIRHSHATNVTVRLLYDPRRVSLEIADDGCGFDTASVRSKATGHFGLTGLRERAQQLQGEVTIESTPGNGTRIRVEAPARERPAGK